ncbi:MAG TPA: hypothetical protein VN914_06835, partial [Polyangia bacterium]|nr:hypothetical protein [Polyangia bacterium]
GIGLQTNDGGTLENLFIDGVTMRRAANPIFINSSARLRTPEKASVGRVRNVFISNVTATEVVQTNGKEPANAATISGRPNVPHENITLTNVRITYQGGGSFADGERDPPYSPSDNYNPRSLGTRPAYGFFVRHVRNLVFQSVVVDFQSNDLRPAWKVVDVNGLLLDGIGVERAGSGAHPSLALRQVRAFKMRGSPQFPVVDLASVPDGSYSPGKNAPPTTLPPPTSPPTPTPDPSPPPSGALVFEAEALAFSHSGTGATIQTDDQAGGGQWLSLDAENTGSWLELVLPQIPAGRYTLRLRYKSNDDRGQAMVWLDGTGSAAQIGEVIDQYAAQADHPTVTLGPVTFAAPGDHRLRLVVAGKNDASSGFLLSADAVILE